jgi:AcrR family transcriptional regulator
MGRTKHIETRERILRHGLDMLSQAGLGGVTLGQLADQVGMSKSGLFAHFGSKEEVQIELLDRGAEVARGAVVMPAMRAAEGRPRLEALIANWLGWSTRAGLAGGCPVAAGMFELDDAEGPVRDHVLAMEKEWRSIVGQCVREAIACGHLRRGLDVEQFVWELCGIYLSHHASLRFVRDPTANRRAQTAVRGLMNRAAADADPPRGKRLKLGNKIKAERGR